MNTTLILSIPELHQMIPTVALAIQMANTREAVAVSLSKVTAASFVEQPCRRKYLRF